LVRSALLRRSLHRSWRWSPVLFHRIRGWSLVFPFPHTTQGGVIAVPSPLVGALVSVLSRPGSSSTLSVVGTAAGCATRCSRAVCPVIFYSPATGSVGPEPKVVPGSMSEAVLQKTNSNITTLKLNFTKKETFLVRITDWNSGAPL